MATTKISDFFIKDVSAEKITGKITLDKLISANQEDSVIIWKNNAWTAQPLKANAKEYEFGFIEKLAKHTPGFFSAAAITTSGRAIAWGWVGYKLSDAPLSSPPEHPIQIPFYSSWTENGAAGADYLDLNPEVKVVDLIWSKYAGMALLSDGTVWVTGINRLNSSGANAVGFLGISNATNIVSAPTYRTGGFVKVNIQNKKGAKIRMSTDNGGAQNLGFAVVTTDKNCFVWGNRGAGSYGFVSATQTTPLNISSGNDFANKVLDYAFVSVEYGSEGAQLLIEGETPGVGTLYVAGRNEVGQTGAFTVGNGTTVSVFTQARKYSDGTGTVSNVEVVNDCAKLVHTLWAGRTSTYYIDSEGQLWGVGNNIPKDQNSYHTWAAGSNKAFKRVSGQWGTDKVIDIKIAGGNKQKGYITTKTGDLYAFGYNSTIEKTAGSIGRSFLGTGAGATNVGDRNDWQNLSLCLRSSTDNSATEQITDYVQHEIDPDLAIASLIGFPLPSDYFSNQVSGGILIAEAGVYINPKYVRSKLFVSDDYGATTDISGLTGNGTVEGASHLFSSVGFIDNNNYAWLAGYNLDLIPSGRETAHFMQFPLRGVEHIYMSGSTTRSNGSYHLFSIFGLSNGTVYGIGDTVIVDSAGDLGVGASVGKNSQLFVSGPTLDINNVQIRNIIKLM